MEWNDKVVKPQAMKAEMGCICSQFGGVSATRFARVFLVYLLDNLHEDLNRIKNLHMLRTMTAMASPMKLLPRSSGAGF